MRSQPPRLLARSRLRTRSTVSTEAAQLEAGIRALLRRPLGNVYRVRMPSAPRTCTNERIGGSRPRQTESPGSYVEASDAYGRVSPSVLAAREAVFRSHRQRRSRSATIPSRNSAQTNAQRTDRQVVGRAVGRHPKAIEPGSCSRRVRMTCFNVRDPTHRCPVLTHHDTGIPNVSRSTQRLPRDLTLSPRRSRRSSIFRAFGLS